MLHRVTALAADPVFHKHLAGRDHIEHPVRYTAVMQALQGLDLLAVEPRHGQSARR